MLPHMRFSIFQTARGGGMRVSRCGSSFETFTPIDLEMGHHPPFGELPATGSRVVLHSLEFSVEAVAGRRISEVSIKPVPPLEPSPCGSASRSPEE